jgi:hypothetical protein
MERVFDEAASTLERAVQRVNRDTFYNFDPRIQNQVEANHPRKGDYGYFRCFPVDEREGAFLFRLKANVTSTDNGIFYEVTDEIDPLPDYDILPPHQIKHDLAAYEWNFTYDLNEDRVPSRIMEGVANLADTQAEAVYEWLDSM